MNMLLIHLQKPNNQYLQTSDCIRCSLRVLPCENGKLPTSSVLPPATENTRETETNSKRIQNYYSVGETYD